MTSNTECRDERHTTRASSKRASMRRSSGQRPCWTGLTYFASTGSLGCGPSTGLIGRTRSSAADAAVISEGDERTRSFGRTNAIWAFATSWPVLPQARTAFRRLCLLSSRPQVRILLGRPDIYAGQKTFLRIGC
jgi:hypothetical protein